MNAGGSDRPALARSGLLDRRARWTTPLLYLTAGLSQATAWSHPDLAPFGWLAIALLAVALDRTRRVVTAFFGTWLVGVLARALGCPYVAELWRIVLDLDPFDAHLAAWGVYTASSVSIAATVAVFFAASRVVARRYPAARLPWWLPVAWMLGEHLSFRFVGLASEAWLMSQWTMQPVLRTLGRLGWWPTLFLWLLAATGVGLAVVHRRPRFALAAAWLPVAFLLPPLPNVGLDRLDGIAAVHVTDDLTLPHGPPPGERPVLVLWPEDARHLRPLLSEGVTRGARIRPLLPGSEATHLIGLVTQSPIAGTQNQLVAVDANGTVVGSRAKRHLMPGGERSFLGLGTDTYTPGRLSTAMETAGRRHVGVICGELMDRDLVAEGVRDGGLVLLIAARAHVMVTPRARRHLLAMQVMRSVEFGVPSVRSSLGGASWFVGSDGSVLAESRTGDNGMLFWDPARGARDVAFRAAPTHDTAATPGPPDGDVAVLYSRTAPRYRTPCPEGRCVYHALEDFACPGAPASAVIVAGHGRPPEWLSHGPADIARAIRCFEPELVVIDACLGASEAMLDALADMEVVVVAAATLIPTGGLVYGPELFSRSDPMERAAAVRLEHGELLRWRTDRAELNAALARARAMPDEEVAAHLVRRSPPQIGVPLAGAGTVLASVDRARASGHVTRAGSTTGSRARFRRRARTPAPVAPPARADTEFESAFTQSPSVSPKEDP